MKKWRIFLGMIILAGVIEFLTPILSTKTGVLVPLIQENCGAIPIFIQSTLNIDQTTTPEVIQGFITCGISGIGFILMPGFIKILMSIYHFVNPKKDEPN